MQIRQRHNALPDLNERIHRMIVSGEFREWRRRTAGMPAPAPKPVAAVRKQRAYHMAPCTQDGCETLVYVVPNRTGKCARHAQMRKRRGRAA